MSDLHTRLRTAIADEARADRQLTQPIRTASQMPGPPTMGRGPQPTWLTRQLIGIFDGAHTAVGSPNGLQLAALGDLSPPYSRLRQAIHRTGVVR